MCVIWRSSHSEVVAAIMMTYRNIKSWQNHQTEAITCLTFKQRYFKTTLTHLFFLLPPFTTYCELLKYYNVGFTLSPRISSRYPAKNINRYWSCRLPSSHCRHYYHCQGSRTSSRKCFFFYSISMHLKPNSKASTSKAHYNFSRVTQYNLWSLFQVESNLLIIIIYFCSVSIQEFQDRDFP